MKNCRCSLTGCWSKNPTPASLNHRLCTNRQRPRYTHESDHPIKNQANSSLIIFAGPRGAWVNDPSKMPAAKCLGRKNHYPESHPRSQACKKASRTIEPPPQSPGGGNGNGGNGGSGAGDGSGNGGGGHGATKQ